MNKKFIIHHLSFTRLQFPDPPANDLQCRAGATADVGQVIRKSRGFTLVELAVVTSIIVTLLGFITISLIRSQQTASLTSTQDLLIADIKQQQLKSMIGDTEGRAASDSYGIHFDSNQYVLFHGATYSVSESTNFVTGLESNMQFNDSGFDIIFSKLSGEIPASAIIKLQDNTSFQLKRIHLNIYGIVTRVESL